MPNESSEIQVWKTPRESVYRRDGVETLAPDGWIFVPSGDPALTRRLKKDAPYWIVVRRRKNRLESIGLLTSAERVASVRAALEFERNAPAYEKKLSAARAARAAKQDQYVVAFRQAVVDFLAFSPRYSELAWSLADAVTDQSVAVGSGTVARTARIPLQQRAEAAVIAWMRHQTTAYDSMAIARVRGERRDVRRRLALRSRELLAAYRSGDDVDPARCPLANALL